MFLADGPKTADSTLVLAHGAGAPMDSEFMNVFARSLGDSGIRVIRFEFPYMASRRTASRRGPPDREPSLRKTWLDVIQSLDAARIFIGGKSMGGRIASLIADEANVTGLICLGYPFHPTGKPQQLRVEHLKTIRTPTLIVQGERDAFGNRSEVATYDLAKNIAVHWLTDGDHSFKPRKASGKTQEDNWRDAIAVMIRFMSAI